MLKTRALIIWLVFLSKCWSNDWKQPVTGLFLTSAITGPTIYYGIKNDNWWIIYLGSALGPIPGYLYAERKSAPLPIIKASAIAGTGLIAGLFYALGAASGSALTGSDSTDRAHARVTNKIVRSSMYICGASTLFDVVFITIKSSETHSLLENVNVEYNPLKNGVAFTFKL